MTENGGRLPSTSSVSSISLLEFKEDTRLVLKAFLGQTLSLPLAERPGRVGGAYKDHGIYCIPLKQKAKEGLHSQDEDVSSPEENKKSFKKLIKRLPGTTRRTTKDPGQDPKSASNSLEKDARSKVLSPALTNLRDQGDDVFQSSTSEEDDGERKQRKKLKKKNKLKKQLSDFFLRRTEKDKEKAEPRPQRPSKLNLGNGPQPVDPLGSPNHPPTFYDEVAGKLEKIAQRSHSIKKISSASVCPRPSPATTPDVAKPPPVCNKDEVVRQLIQVLSMEADAITSKIQSDPFLRSKLTRLSYPSFTKLMDAFGNCELEQAPPLTASPTLRRVAVTMEVSRRVVTATGTQRMQGYAERYMENFAPWVKSHGGWENIVQLEEASEYD